jgi:hypothetical protein
MIEKEGCEAHYWQGGMVALLVWPLSGPDTPLGGVVTCVL